MGETPYSGAFMDGHLRRMHNAADADPRVIAVRRRWHEAIDPIVNLYESAKRAGANAWPQILQEHNELTLRDFLVESCWPEDDIELFGRIGTGMGGFASLMNIAFCEILAHTIRDVESHQFAIVDGSDRFPHALAATRIAHKQGTVRDHVRYGA